MKEIEIYNSLIDECKSIIGETNYKQNANTLESRWELGRAISQTNDEMKRQKIYGLKVIEKLSEDLGEGFSTRNLHYCVQFFKEYPINEYKDFATVLQNLPEGKNTTWRDMCHEHLKSSPEGQTERKDDAKKPPRSTFNISEIEGSFKNFLCDIMGVDDYEQKEDRWEKFKEYLM